LVCPPTSAVGRALFPHPGGSFVGGATESLSSLWSRTAAPDHCFHCHHQSSSGRCSFISSSSTWRAHGGKSCGDFNVWSWSLAMAGGCSSDFITRRFFGPDWRAVEKSGVIPCSCCFLLCISPAVQGPFRKQDL
jgi:hypothetical protein